jgi:hypothetical protein
MRRTLLILAIILCLGTPSLAADLYLAWDPSDGATGYTVQLSTDLGATWSETRDTGNSVTFTWTGAPDTGLVLLRASAYNAQGEATNYKKGAWYRGDWGAPSPASSLGLK